MPVLRRLLLAVVLPALLAAGALAPTPTVAAAGDIGWEGPSFNGASAAPTGEKPESKLWFNDGIWWGSLWDTVSSRYEIFRLNTTTQAWTSTNIPLDTRSSSRADTLWDGVHLYVASHVFSEKPASGFPSNLYRFSYNAGTDTYTLDATWPQQINNVRSETLVIDKDSTGQLWATWVQNDAGGQRRVHVNRTTSGDSSWGTPFVMPGTSSATQVASDDISSVIAFDVPGSGADRVGVLWSNQRVSPKTFNFAYHDDNAADGTWSGIFSIAGGTNFGDDHINLKALMTDNSGRVYALVKTSNTQSTQPLIVLLTRSAGGTWSQDTVWTKGNNLTRPVVLLDTTNSVVHAFASTESGGKVYHKTAPFSNTNFATGLGTVVMEDASSNDINNLTSLKGNLSSATGLVILASNDSTKRYWHHYEALGGGGGNVAPACSNVSGTVAQDSPTGVDIAPSCTDGDGPNALTYSIGTQGTKGVASVVSGQLHYVPNAGQSGPDSFTYTAFDGLATSAPATVDVTITPTGGGTPQTATPDADTYLRSDQPTTANGTSSTLRARLANFQMNAYLRFTISGVGATSSSAVLRLYVSDPSVDAGKLHQVIDDSWSEGIDWNGRPATGALIVDLGARPAVGYIDIDVSSYVNGDGVYSFAIIGEHDDVVQFHSREGANDPQLVVTP